MVGYQQQQKYSDVTKMCAEKIYPVGLKMDVQKCEIKKQTTFNHKNLYKLMRSAPKLMNCRVNITYFVKDHEILMNLVLRNL